MKQRKYKHAADRIGERFGKWTITEAGYRCGTIRMFVCRCDCGTVQHVSSSNLTKGKSTKCQTCQGHQRTTRAVKANKVHGVVLRKGRWFGTCDCGRMKSTQGQRCKKCDLKARVGRPWKYPESLGSIARRSGRSLQRVHQVLAEKGWNGMVKYFDAMKKGAKP